MKNLIDKLIAQLLLLYARLSLKKPKKIQLPSLSYDQLEVLCNNEIYVYINKKYAYKKPKIKKEK